MLSVQFVSCLAIHPRHSYCFIWTDKGPLTHCITDILFTQNWLACESDLKYRNPTLGTVFMINFCVKLPDDDQSKESVMNQWQ